MKFPSFGNPSFKRYGNIYFLPFYVHIIHIFTKLTIKPTASIVCFMQRHELDDVPKALYCIFRLIKCFNVQFYLNLILMLSYD